MDQQFSFEDVESSSVNSIEHNFDYETLEHVVTIEYRVKVFEAVDPEIKQVRSKSDPHFHEEIMRLWSDCLRPMLEKYPDLDKYLN